MKEVTLVHNKKKFIFRQFNETDKQFLIDQFGSPEEFQKKINDFADFNCFAETLVRTMHHLLITEVPFNEFKDIFYNTQSDVAALYYKLGPCIGVTKKMQKAANKQVDENWKLRKENRKLKSKLAMSEMRNFKSSASDLVQDVRNSIPFLK